MDEVKPERLVQAAKIAIALISAVHETIWTVYPDELLALTDEPEQKLVELIRRAKELSQDF